MSDDEYEYEYSDNDEEMMDGDDGDGDDQFEYTDEEEEETNDTAVLLENTYYNAKGLRESSIEEATEEFERVLQLEEEAANAATHDDKDNSEAASKMWSYKALKQLVKLNLRAGNYSAMMEYYQRMLQIICVGNIAPNAIEKGVHGMLDRISLLLQQAQMPFATNPSAGSANEGISSGAAAAAANGPQAVARQVYDATLSVFHPVKGPCPNERLWFKTNLKFGQLLYEMHETAHLQSVLRDLTHIDLGGGGSGKKSSPYKSGGTSSSSYLSSSAGSSSSGAAGGTNQMEIYALQIQLCWRQGELAKLEHIYQQAMNVRGGIPHPRTLALIQELGGKMYMTRAAKSSSVVATTSSSSGGNGSGSKGAEVYEAASQCFFQAFKSYDEAGDRSRLRCLKYLVLASMLHASTINPFDSQEARPYRDDPEIVQMTNLVQAFQDNDIVKFERILRGGRGNASIVANDEFMAQHVADLLRTIRTQVLKRVLVPYTRISLQGIANELNQIPVPEVEGLLIPLLLDGQIAGELDQVEGVLYLLPTGDKKDAVDPKLATLKDMISALEDLSKSIASTKLRDSAGSSSSSTAAAVGPGMMTSSAASSAAAAAAAVAAAGGGTGGMLRSLIH